MITIKTESEIERMRVSGKLITPQTQKKYIIYHKPAGEVTTVTDPKARTAHIRNHMLDADGNRDFSSTVPGTRLVGDI